MSYPDNGQAIKGVSSYGGAAIGINRATSRIESDVERVKAFTDHVESTTSRIVRHAHSLGYFEPPKSAASQDSAPTPVITTMADALAALGRAIDQCSGSLNLFD